MKPLIIGTTNIIAIDSSKKESFVQKYNDAISSLKRDSAVQEPINSNLQASQIPDQNNFMAAPNFNQNNEETKTNADLLSQSFVANDIKPSDNMDSSIRGESALQTNPDLTAIVYDIAKIQDDLDKIVAKLIMITPDKSINTEQNLPSQEESIVNGPPNMTSGLLENAPAQEVTPFFPSNGNIFDEPQGPNIAA